MKETLPRMAASANYKIVALGPWRLAVLPSVWSPDVERRILEIVEAQCWSKHPQTLAVQLPQNGAAHDFYLKVFHPSKSWGAVKDVFRISRAFRAWRVGLALSRAGFEVPFTIAAGEQRRCRFLRRAFILTQKIDAQPVHSFLARLVQRRDENWTLAVKRAELRRLADLVRRFHENGFVHGDLVASNILLAEASGGGRAIYFMDNDRTRRYPGRAPQLFSKRNLIQLNRMPLPGITLQDRLRFLLAYLCKQRLSQSERKLARWFERKTRQRRHECDGMDAGGDFRRLMRWSGEMPASAEVKHVD
jgi:hypothetical protein